MTRKLETNLQLPAILFGSERQVQKAWRKLVKSAFKDGQWNSTLSSLEMVTFEPRDALVISLGRGLRSTFPDCWRMYVVGPAFKDIFFKLTPAPFGPHYMEKFDKLLLEGMKNLWFIIGLLEGGNGRFNLSYFPRTGPTLDVLYDYVDRFAYWLPELLELEDFYVDDFALVGGYGVEERIPWAINIALLAADCDHELPMESASDGKILIESLLSVGLIEPFNGRYRARRQHRP